MPKLSFWYEFASNYSYLSAVRIEELARAAGVEIVWRPFLLGPIFGAQGWNTSPFNIYPAKGHNMRRDMQRITQDRGLPLKFPEPFPANSLLATRIAFSGEDAGWTPEFSRAVFEEEFGRGADISSTDVMTNILKNMGLDASAVIDNATNPDIKHALKNRVRHAEDFGIFGAPSFVTERGELFWGDDRLDQALEWALRE